MKSALSLTLLLGLRAAVAQFQPIGQPFKSPVTVAAGLAAKVIFTNVSAPLGGLDFDSAGTLLAIEIGVGISTYQSVTTPTRGWLRTPIVKNPALTYGIQVDDTRRTVYASTGDSVLVYAYDPTTKAIVPGSTTYPLINGIPADGEFSSHPILLEKDALGNLTAILVGTGPLTNIDPSARDPESGRSQVRRFVIPRIQPTVFPPPPIPWKTGELVAYGIRNPAGFAFEPLTLTSPALKKSLIVVENGASIEQLAGFTPKFGNDNPADELNAVNFPTDLKKFYGFPDCTTLWNPTADPVGNPQYTSLPRGAQISLNLPIVPDRPDKWCQDSANQKAPLLSIQAHSSPVDIKFYTTSSPSKDNLAIPNEYIGDAFVSFFGSFNRDPPTGYGVVRVFFPSLPPTAQPYQFIVQAKDTTTCPGTCITPSGLALFGGKLFVSSVLTGEIFLVERSSFTTNPLN